VTKLEHKVSPYWKTITEHTTRMYDRPWTACCRGAGHTLPAADLHSPGRSTFLLEMTSWQPSKPSWICDIISEIRLDSSIDAYLVEEQSCQISSRSDLKWRSFVPTTTRKTTTWVEIWEQFLIQKFYKVTRHSTGSKCCVGRIPKYQIVGLAKLPHRPR